MKTVSAPTLKELITLRVMILFGSVYMFFFIKDLLNSRMIAFAPLFWMLICVLIFNCLQVLHEWIHYLFITVPPSPAPTRTYTVDIFTTFCAGEPYEMIVETLTAIQAITYPHTTYLCDEADDPYLKKVCKDLGVQHITRTVKIDAKAGNINNALRQSSGELCVVLDPDHVPEPDFLDPIIAHFDNPEIGFVQIVQSYKNYRGKLIAKGAAQQTFQFYGPIMMTMNRYGTVLAIGANCTFRRTALESIGGHAAGLAEDMHTAMQLHAKGWKSIYVPAVLAKGLVPDTLSAYYSQQLKWARGVFELLVTSYPKLFSKFTWRQKLHYGVIPLHYFSGVIFLINFLIPIISLIFNVSPINIDVEHFAVMGFPLALSIFAIRHYVQAWVMEDEERGFHLVGGLLMIGTWWIYILGLVYTILRKKVPYVPTPKDDQEDNNWPLNVPNLIIISLSLFAIVYGLSYDWSPYTLIMSGFAFSNCIVLAFTVVASRQQQFRRLKQRYRLMSDIISPISFIKNIFWKTRHVVYRRGRGLLVPASIFIACFSLYKAEHWNLERFRNYINPKEIPPLQAGIFAPDTLTGRNSFSLVKHYQHRINKHFSIVSMYLSWGDKPECFLPEQEIDSIYQNGSMPMITWEPWQNLFHKNKVSRGVYKDEKVFESIVRGEYDDYLLRFSTQVKALKRPVYIRFAHEADNPAYPWSHTGKNTPAEFKEAWRYVYNYFQRQAATNAVWVWNPWKASAVNSYFPGREYVDWLGVTILNYASANQNQRSYTMEQLYTPFHEQPVFRSGIPVMIAEMGSLQPQHEQLKWFEAASRAIRQKFPAIKSLVFFYSGIDRNVVSKEHPVYNWRFRDIEKTGSLFDFKDSPGIVRTLDYVAQVYKKDSSIAPAPALLKVHGVNYNKGKNWLSNYHGFTRKELVNDFDEMKARGFTTIKWFGPGIYDKNILRQAGKSGIKIVYSFWVPADTSIFRNPEDRDKLSRKIFATVKRLKENKNIISWHIANDVNDKFRERLHKPALLYHQQSYYRWLSSLLRKIKSADANRQVSVDVKVTPDLAFRIEEFEKLVPEIDMFGLVADEKSDLNVLKHLKSNFFYSSVEAGKYLQNDTLLKGVFISNWQDEETKSYVTFNGLKDRAGRNKRELYLLNALWKKAPVPPAFPTTKILLPAMATYPDTKLRYTALVEINGKWSIATNENGISYQWALVKNDRFGNPLELNIVGDNPALDLWIPENPSLYRLYLFMTRGNDVEIIRSRLNTPFYTSKTRKDTL